MTYTPQSWDTGDQVTAVELTDLSGAVVSASSGIADMAIDQSTSHLQVTLADGDLVDAGAVPAATDATVAPILQDANSASYAAISDVSGGLTVNVTAHGAKVDGITDDSAAYSAAIAAATPGGTVVIPDGTMLISTQVDLSAARNVTIRSGSVGRPGSSIVRWGGADNVSAHRITGASGICFDGVSFSAGAGFGSNISGTSQRAAHIDARPAPGSSAQTFLVTIRNCFFTQDGTLVYDPSYSGDGTDVTGANCVCIATGSGHTWKIENNDFYRSAIAIEGTDNTVTPGQATQNVVVCGNFFEPLRRVAHITDPGAQWTIQNNSVEPLFNGSAGFVKLVKNIPAGLVAVAIEDNWCGDITVGGNGGVQIEAGGGPFTIARNTLGSNAASTAIRFTCGLTDVCQIIGNRHSGSGTFIAWQSGTYTGSPAAWIIGNSVPAIVGNAGSAPAQVYGVTATQSGNALTAPGFALKPGANLELLTTQSTQYSCAQYIDGTNNYVLRGPGDGNLTYQLAGTSTTPKPFQSIYWKFWNGTGFDNPLTLRDSALVVATSLIHTGTTAGFYGSAAVAKPAVTGSLASGAALQSLIAALASLGLITDSTTA